MAKTNDGRMYTYNFSISSDAKSGKATYITDWLVINLGVIKDKQLDATESQFERFRTQLANNGIKLSRILRSFVETVD
jgi:hypothetical protein